jgi:signal transduction histidine kinase
MILGSAAILLPVALGIALLIANQARHLRRDRERIAKIERWRAALAAALAHDLRSPLATVRMVVEELRDDDGSVPRTDFADTALRQLDRINSLAAGLLDLDRIETRGSLRLDLRPLAVRDAVTQSLRHLGPDVVVDVDPDLVVLADRDRFEQIVVNLVVNGIRHGRPPVEVRVRAEAGTIRLDVRDHGTGVPAAARKRLFTRFSSDDPESVGLGLWIVVVSWPGERSAVPPPLAAERLFR